jgi:signal transduction histidine kinase
MLNELAEMSPAPFEKIREQLGHIRSSATQLTGMVNDLVADAMMDALDITIRQEPVDIAAMLAEVVTANKALADRKRQAIHLVTPPVRWTSCDPDRLREAVDNLLSNAIKYSPTGGSIELSMSGDNEFTVILVKDEGAGLSQEDLGRLFGRFQRLSAKPTAGESSTGLGLSIVKRIVELHGGTIAAESPGPGRGSTFMIRLPMTADASS